MSQELADLQKVLSYRFKEVKHLELALTHTSYANERGELSANNERLEYLGDAVLELAVTDYLFKHFPDSPEGQLTRMRAKLVSEPTLAVLAREMGLPGMVRLGRGEDSQGGRDRDSLLSDAVEAVLGAVFLDGGFEAARKAVEVVLASRWPTEPELPRAKDFKSRLQEFTQREFRARPVYALSGSYGPEHDKVFEVTLTLPDGRCVVATGQSMKKAEQTSAAKALKMLTRESGAD